MHIALAVKTFSRSSGSTAVGKAAYRSGSSIVAKAAYRSGDKIHGDRENFTHDYTHKSNILLAEVITPNHAPEWMNDRESLWNAVEAGEKRKDAQQAKEILLVLPNNMSHEQHKEAVRGFVKDNLTTRGLVADVGYHSDGNNPHAHIMFTLRGVEGDGFGKKQTGYNDLPNGLQGLDGKKQLYSWRKSYEMHLNNISNRDGLGVTYDLRSNKEKGIDREPQPKLGPKVANLEKKGYQTERGNQWRYVQHKNLSAGRRVHVGSYKQIGGGPAHHAFVVESARRDIAKKYYEVMYGSEEARNIWEHER